MEGGPSSAYVSRSVLPRLGATPDAFIFRAFSPPTTDPIPPFSTSATVSMDAFQMASLANDHIVQHQLQHPDQEQGHDDASGNGKRKAEDGSQGPQGRAKRNRYISIACNECKRRKVSM